MHFLETLQTTIEARKHSNENDSYVSSLLTKGHPAIAEKIQEEAQECVDASNNDDSDHLVREVADLLFHSMIMLSHHNKSITDVVAELHRRQGISGHKEKAMRSTKP